MKKIEVKKWKEADGKGGEVESNTLMMINALISRVDPAKMPKGIDKFRTFGRIGRAFDKADKTGTLELDTADYAFLKGMVDNDVPAIWAMNKELMEAVEGFLDAEEKE